ncbi:MAG TPA: outer membrane protein assembly factor BamB [Burkholderiales bacterium]|nr:outer membrane protein assembly factor BamB [Burkholderiales bacterium]
MLTRYWRILGLSAILLAVGGCGSSGPVVTPAELTEFKPSASLKVLWRGYVAAASKNAYFPQVSGGVVYAVGEDGVVTGFDVSSGGSQVQIEAGERVTGGVGVGGGLVLLGTRKGEVLAFETSGKALWKVQLSSEVLAPPAAEDGIVVARTADGRIHGLDAATGKSKWLFQQRMPSLSVRSNTGLVVQRGGVFAGFPGGRLVALALANGNVAWEGIVALPRGATELERVADVTSLPVIDFPRICAAAFQGRVACFDVQRGALLWARDASSLAGIALDARHLYYTDDRGAVLALDKANGASVWRQDKLADRRVSAPLAVGRYVVVGDFEGYVHLLSAEDGSFAARIATDGETIIAPPVAIGSSTFLVQTRDGGVLAIAIQ